MSYPALRQILETSPSVSLIRSPNAAMFLSFVQKAFKAEHSVWVPRGRMLAMLGNHLEELREIEPDRVLSEDPSQYLDRWCQAGHMVSRYRDDSDDPVYELTSDTERVLKWVRSLEASEFVGTESRIKGIVQVLAELAENTNASPDDRIDVLRRQRADIDRKIEAIRETRTVEVFTETQIRERFQAAVALGQELMGDFQRVREIFKQITRDIAAKHAEEGATRGSTLEFALRQDDALRGTAMGQSFYAFWSFLLSAERQAELFNLVDVVYALPAIPEQAKADRFLRRLPDALLAEGRLVVETNQKMSAQLRQVLDTAAVEQRREVMRRIGDIKLLAHRVREDPPGEDFIGFDEKPIFEGAVSRPLWSPMERVIADDNIQEFTGAEFGAAAEKLLRMTSVDFGELKRNIAETIARRGGYVLLVDVLEEFPPHNGILDVIAYFVIAFRDDSHAIVESQPCSFELAGDPPRRIRMPNILFGNTTR